MSTTKTKKTQRKAQKSKSKVNGKLVPITETPLVEEPKPQQEVQDETPTQTEAIQQDEAPTQPSDVETLEQYASSIRIEGTVFDHFLSLHPKLEREMQVTPSMKGQLADYDKKLEEARKQKHGILAPTIPQSEEEIQQRLNEVLWRHGRQAMDLNGQEDWAKFLAEQGLVPEDATPQRIAEAQQASLERVDTNTVARELVWLASVTEKSSLGDGAEHEVWRTACGTYTVVRIKGENARFVSIAKIAAEASEDQIIQNDMKSLEVAFDSVVKYHRRKGVETNAVKRLKEAERAKLHLLQVKTDSMSQPREMKEKKVRQSSGSREGGVPAKINAILSSTPQSVVTIATACGVDEARVRTHCNYWVKKGKFVKDAEGNFSVVG